MDNQDQAKAALAAYKSDYSQAKSLSAYQAAQQTISSMTFTELGGQAMRVVDSDVSDDLIAGTEIGATDATMVDGVDDTYTAYFAAGDYFWVVNQTTKQGA